jgi:hypothetical protein
MLHIDRLMCMECGSPLFVWPEKESWEEDNWNNWRMDWTLSCLNNNLGFAFWFPFCTNRLFPLAASFRQFYFNKGRDCDKLKNLDFLIPNWRWFLFHEQLPIYVDCVFILRFTFIDFIWIKIELRANWMLFNLVIWIGDNLYSMINCIFMQIMFFGLQFTFISCIWSSFEFAIN